MERKTAAPKTADAKTAPTPKTATPKRTAPKRTPKGATAAKTAAKGSASSKTPKGASGTAKGSAKTAPKSAPTTRATGPSPERIRLAKTVAGLRAKGTKWNEIAAATGKSEPTLATLRKDVRAGKFASISPAKDRVPASGNGSF